jgi:SAM-dependent methyltransferase
MIYRYGMKLGAKLLLHGKVSWSLPYLIRPVNYWRAAEYKLVCDEANFQPSDRILDIGSPKLLSLYLAKVIGAEVFSTDIDSYFVEKQTFIRDLENVPPDRLHIAVEDGRNLSFQDNYFNKVYSISVLEHIPNDGDTECIREIARVMSKGGRCFITVPFAPESRIEYLDRERIYWSRHSVASGKGKTFYQRRYSENDLFSRIINSSTLKLEKLQYVGENVMTNSSREISEILPVFTGPVEPLISRLFHTEPADSWQSLKKPLCALIVLGK